MRHLILIPHIRIQNANALSSPYTIGFPAMTAWLGAVRALQKNLNENGWSSAQLTRVGISCHDFNLQTYKGRGDYVNSIIGTGNPLDKEGKRSAFIEEARCHLEVTLLIEYHDRNYAPNLISQLKADIAKILQSRMKLAGGDILQFGYPEFISVQESDPSDLKKHVLPRLMLGYVLKERRDLMKTVMEQEGKDALEALLDYLKVRYRATQAEDGKAKWSSERQVPGWIVPIAVGFQGLTVLGSAKYQRDETTPHRFAESIITLGEFVMPYRIQQLDEMLWQYQVDLERNLYLCCNQTNL